MVATGGNGYAFEAFSARYHAWFDNKIDMYLEQAGLLIVLARQNPSKAQEILGKAKANPGQNQGKTRAWGGNCPCH